MEQLQKILSMLVTADENWTFLSLQFFALFLLFYLFFIILSPAKRVYRKIYVVAFSLFFAYKGGGLWFLLPAITIVSWLLTRLMGRAEHNRRLLCSITIIVTLAPLVALRYIHSSLLIPIGISFFTLQAISYTVDVYRKKFRNDASFIDYSFFLTFFPLLLAGPITRAEVLIGSESNDKKKQSSDDGERQMLVSTGLWLIIVGIIKKAAIADYIAQYNDMVFLSPETYNSVEVIMAVLGYSLQIFFDFSGYSDMAIGLAALMGYQLPANFRQPYQSLSLTDFWRRWHIALSSWLRDYVYIPLGGNRTHRLKHYFNIVITMLVAALWHGSTLMFMIWGGLHAVGLIVNKAFSPLLKGLKNSVLFNALSWLLTFVFVTFAWIFFRSPDISHAAQMITSACSSVSIVDIFMFAQARGTLVVVMFLGILLLTVRGSHADWIAKTFCKMPFLLKLIIFIAAVQLAINSSSGTIVPFIYSHF